MKSVLVKGMVAPAAMALLAACGGGAGKRQADACAAAWNEGVGLMRAESAALAEAEGELEQRRKDAEKAAAAAEKRLAGLTIRREEAAAAYGERLKGKVVASKMRLGSIQPLREESGKPVAAVRFDAEIQGEYKRSAKMLAGLYDQPKAFFLDRVEVNITDERKGWSLVKMQFHVFQLTEGPPALPADPGLPASYASALDWAPGPQCASVPAPPEAESARAELRAREAAARALRRIEAVEEATRARVAIADDLLRRRDDDRAVWSAHADELVEKAKTSITGLAELRFNAKGEPDWKM